MESIFNKTANEFLQELMDMEHQIKMIPENIETPNERAAVIMNWVYYYVKQMHENRWKLSYMIRQFAFILNTGEYKYLFGGWMAQDKLFTPLREKGTKEAQALANDIVYATRWLETYASLHEEYAPTEKRQIRLEVARVLTAARQWKCKTVSADGRGPMALRIYNHLDEYVVGQEDLKKTLALTVHKYLMTGERSPVLVIGPTGSGKNYSLEKLAEMEDVNKEAVVYVHDASGITSAGFRGSDIQDIFNGFKKKCDALERDYDRGIICLDEIDKIMAPNTDSNGENMNAIVQQQLLSAIAGTSTICGVNTKNILFIMCGAFTNLEEMEKEKKASFGFDCGVKNIDGLSEKDITLRENLIKYGTQKEFLGRISHIVRIQRLKKEELRKILLHERTGVIKRKQQSFGMNGLELEFEEDVIDMIVEKVYQEDLGARSVTNIVEALLGTYEFDMILQGYEKMIVHAGMFQNEEPYFEKSEDEKTLAC